MAGLSPAASFYNKGEWYLDNKLQIVNINGVDCYEKDGTAYLKLEAVARGLGFIQVKNNIE